MSSRPAAAALLCVLSQFRTSTAAPCTPRAQLEGDSAAVARVTDELRRLGVTTGPATNPADHCRSIDAAVALDDDGISVAIRDHARHSEGRVVSDAAVAAAWIDSWLRDDFDETSAAPEAAATTAIVAPRDVPAQSLTVAASPTLLDRATLAAVYEQSYSSDGATWSGGSASACVHVGPACLGGRIGAAFQPATVVGTNSASGTRSDLTAFATANVAFAIGRMIVSPELGLGVGRMATQAVDECKMNPAPPNCDPTDPMCAMVPDSCIGPDGMAYVTEHVATITPRASVALRIAIPLFEHVWLDGIAALAVSPLSHREPFTRAMDPGTMPPPMSGLPGEPLSTIQVGVGLRIGAP